MSFLSKLTAVAAVALGVHALQGKRTAKPPREGTPARKPATVRKAPPKTATATRSASRAADSGAAAPKSRARKRSARKPSVKNARS